MPRAAGSRTGRKHLKRKKQLLAAEEKASQQPRLAALEDAVAAARVAFAVAAGDKGAVSAWLDDVLKQVERQVEIDEDRAEFERAKHERFIAVGVACVEAVKRRTFKQYPSPSERSMLSPFLHALQVNREEWSFAYPSDKCDKCAFHLGWCHCRVSCGKCGQNVPRRAWQVCFFYPANDMCVCEKILNFAGRLCG